ncbi:DUF934 domain-containing protein [Marinobacter sp. UBA3607]|jgi:uncharacterized protein (DUF934 family)|uniref:DUF934 domain-containing protein n=1 Tax=Marinobacter sp. UBA3607 TaxID=1946820 RepID=UPI000E8243F7|nr:DUF934 domain-containing protein [Marinobacter sp. UBA3607]HBM48900.1 oxidoreductase [Marinobacter sp.]|tara:strand:+ start:4248 stop:4754 length:507 start_codon:yes stop_codon:yes gene_type:complete
MPDVIAVDGTLRNDNWAVVARPEAGESLAIPEGQPALIPVDLWLAGAEHYAGREDIGVWFDSHHEPELLADRANQLPVIAVNFPRFVDGRGYSIGRLLRERYGYSGELRAIGDVLLDQLQFMKRCGFDAFVLRADKDATKAARCLNFFSQTYQAAADTDVPLFRRRAS